MNRIHANSLLQQSHNTQVAIKLSDDKLIFGAHLSSLDERAQSCLGNKVALAFLSRLPPICADFFESRLLGIGRPLCLRFPVASLVFSAEGAKHTSPGQAALKARAAPGGASLRNCTLQGCDIVNTKDGFHRKATENSQLSIGDRLRTEK
ncbi:MAG: hypothetical protein GX945_08410 [Lentisphaerae bacterium]|jgi:hypothetical protein|nr:hypothetical protein [Lentisphaerota bacterium]